MSLLFWTRFVIRHIWRSDYCVTWSQWNRKEYFDEYSLWTMPAFWWWEFSDLKKQQQFFHLLVLLTKVSQYSYLSLKHVLIEFFFLMIWDQSQYKGALLLLFDYTFFSIETKNDSVMFNKSDLILYSFYKIFHVYFSFSRKNKSVIEN